MDGGLDDGDVWADAEFIAVLIRAAEEGEATRNPNLTPTTPASASLPTHDPFASCPLRSPACPATSHPSPPRRFSPPPKLSQQPPPPPPTATARDDAGIGFSPPRQLSACSVAERGSLGDRECASRTSCLPPVEKTLLCSLEELYNGTKKKIKITRNVAQPDGRVEVETEVLAVEVLPGWKKGTKITFPNKGDKLHGHLAQDLTFVLDSKPHDVYNLEGNNLLVKHEIPLVDALAGAEINLRTLDGRNLPVRVEEVVCPGYEVVLENEGWPIRKKPRKKGKLVIKFDVTFPLRLSPSQRTAIRQILGR